MQSTLHTTMVNATADVTDDITLTKDREIQTIEAYLRANVVQSANESDHDYDEQFKNAFLEWIQFKDGQYFVPLQWKPGHPELKDNLQSCQSRIHQVMIRLHKLNLVEAYVDVMRENIEKSCVSEIPDAQQATNGEGYFLPHFPVLRDSKTTLLPMVFDSSSASPSLNSCLYEGPNMLQYLTKLLLLFCTKKIALSADIARVFLSVRLLEEDRKYVKFLWFKDNDVTKELLPYHCIKHCNIRKYFESFRSRNHVT
jgi:hypothetical protein